MKKIILLTMVFVMMFVSLGGCYWGYEGRDRGGRNGRDGGHDYRGDSHDRGGDRERDYEERR